MTDIKLSDDNLAQIVAKSIMDGLTPETRNQLISNAVKTFLDGKVDAGRYNSATHLQDLFNRAVINVASKQLEAQLLVDEAFAANIKSVIDEASTRAFGQGREKLVDALACAIHKAVVGDRY